MRNNFIPAGANHDIDIASQRQHWRGDTSSVLVSGVVVSRHLTAGHDDWAEWPGRRRICSMAYHRRWHEIGRLWLTTSKTAPCAFRWQLSFVPNTITAKRRWLSLNIIIIGDVMAARRRGIMMSCLRHTLAIVIVRRGSKRSSCGTPAAALKYIVPTKFRMHCMRRGYDGVDAFAPT